MYCELNNIDIYYEDIGKGIPVIMIHGYCIDHRMMMGCMEPFFSKKSGWRRIYIDLPGMGKTKGGKWIADADTMLKVILEFIDKVIPDQKFLVAGYSYGGYLARGIVNKKAELVNGLFLLCPVIIANREKREVPIKTVLVQDMQLIAELTPTELQYFDMVIQTRENWNRFKNEVLPCFELADMDYLRKFKKNGYGFSFEIEDIEKKYDMPTVIATGRCDSVVGYKDAWRILNSYPKATFAVVDNAGHDLQIEQPKLFYELIDSWISSIEQ